MNKTRKGENPFVQIPLWWATSAFEATSEPAALVCIYLLYAAWKAGYRTFPLPNEWLEKHGVHRHTKSRVLRKLEAAGLILIEWRGKKSPLVTLVKI